MIIKIVIIRLLLGKYAIGESRGFLLHSGLMGQVSINNITNIIIIIIVVIVIIIMMIPSQNNRLVRVIECPPLRLETPQEWTQVIAPTEREALQNSSHSWNEGYSPAP